MIINVDQLKNKGYFTRVINKRNKIYDELIKKHSENLEMLRYTYDDNEPRGYPEIFMKNPQDLTDEEKQILYQRAHLLKDSERGRPSSYNKSIDKLDKYDWFTLQSDLYTFGDKSINELIILEIDYSSTILASLINAKNSIYIFSMDKNDINATNFIYFKKYFRKLKEEGKQVRFVISQDMSKQTNLDRINYTYTDEEFNLIVEIDNFLKRNNGEGVLFREFLGIESEEDLENSWNLHQVITVNKHIDRIVNVIKRKNFSPFETMVFLHKFVTSNFYYNKGGLEESRILPGIYYNGKIVCSGYASLIKAVIDKLDSPLLKAQVFGCKFFHNTGNHELKSSHCQNLIYIKDDKYQIDGYYIEDATFDSRKLFNGPRADGGFAHCLLPLNALRHYNEYIYASVYDKNRYKNLMINNTKMKGIDDDYRPIVERKYGKYSNPISVKKYLSAMKVVFKNQITRGKFDPYNEIDKSIQKACSIYDYRADLSFESAEYKLLSLIFGKRKRKSK